METFGNDGVIHKGDASDTAQQTVVKVRAKFRVSAVTHHEGNCGQVRLMAAHGPGNETWSKYTPSGTVEMMITNPDALKHFKPGLEVFVDFTPA